MVPYHSVHRSRAGNNVYGQQKFNNTSLDFKAKSVNDHLRIIRKTQAKWLEDFSGLRMNIVPGGVTSL